MKKSSFLFFFFFYQLTFAQLSITGPSTISQNWPYVTFSNYCVSGDTGTYSTWTLPSNGGYFNFAYSSNNPQIIAAQTKIKVTPLNCVSWGDNASWRPFYNVPASISVTNGGMSATKTILMTPSTYGQTVQPLSSITKTGCASDSIIVGTVTSSSSNSRALQRTGPNEGCRLGHKWYYYDQNSGNWISFLTVNSQPSISSCSTTLSCLDSETGKTSQLFGYNVVDSTEWLNGIIKLDISQVPPNLADSLQVYLEVQHKQGVVLSSDTLQLNVLSTPPVTSVSANGPLTFCLGDSVVLTASGGSSYSWSTGDTTQSITVKNGGNYSVTAVGQGNQCGNANTVSTTINVVPVINTPTIIPPNPFGTIMSGSTTLVLTSSSNVNYSYQWGARGGVVDSSGNGYAYIDWGVPDTNAAVWVIISNGYCTDSVGIDIVIISGVGLDDNSLNSIILSPNPNSGLFSINVDQEHIGSSYQILDNLGRLIDKGIIRELSQDFNLSDKPKGIYRIQVSNDKALKTLNVVIQ